MTFVIIPFGLVIRLHPKPAREAVPGVEVHVSTKGIRERKIRCRINKLRLGNKRPTGSEGEAITALRAEGTFSDSEIMSTNGTMRMGI